MLITKLQYQNLIKTEKKMFMDDHCKTSVIKERKEDIE